MVHFVVRRPRPEKATLGLVLFPADLARLTNGSPARMSLYKLKQTVRVELKEIEIFFFRDLEEFETALMELGAKT